MSTQFPYDYMDAAGKYAVDAKRPSYFRSRLRIAAGRRGQALARIARRMLFQTIPKGPSSFVVNIPMTSRTR